MKLRIISISFVTFAVTTIGCVLLFFKPFSENDSPGTPWPDAVALLLYLAMSVLLHDWLARVAESSYRASFALGAAQAILIIDLLARGERGLITAMAGLGMLAITWGTLAYVHDRVSRPIEHR